MGEINTKGQVLSGIFWKFGERISAQLVSFIITIVLARILMPRDYGVVSLVAIFITIANVFVTSGLSTSLIQKRDADQLDFSTIFYCSLVVAGIIYILLFLAAPSIAAFYKMTSLTLVIRVFAIKIPLAAFNSIQHAYVSKKLIFKKFFISTLFGTLISGVIGIVLALQGFGVWALVFQYLTNTVIDTTVLCFTVKWRPRLMFSWKRAKSLIDFGWKVLVADLIGTSYDQLRSFVIGKVYSPQELAYYTKGKSFPELITNNIDVTICSVLFPVLSNASGDVKQVKKMNRRAMKTSAYIIFPMMAGMIAMASPVVLLLLGQKWEQSVVYVQLICLAKGLSTITSANLQGMRAMGRSDTVLKLEFFKKPVGIVMILISMKISVLAVAVSMPVYAVYAAILNMQPNRKL